MDKRERLELIFAKFGSAAPFHTRSEAYDGINEIIDDIEDMHSPDAFDPHGRSRNRIYGPSDRFSSATSFKGLVEYSHVAHITLIFENGAFMICDRKGRVLIDKPGSDGRCCPR